MSQPLNKETVFECLQAQIIHYLMIEKYGLRAERNALNPIHHIIQREEVQQDLDNLFGEDNSELIERIFWVVNDASCTYNPSCWDEEEPDEEENDGEN